MQLLLLLLEVLLGNRKVNHLELHPKNFIFNDLLGLNEVLKLVLRVLFATALNLRHINIDRCCLL
jgi:hypothetical protein